MLRVRAGGMLLIYALVGMTTLAPSHPVATRAEAAYPTIEVVFSNIGGRRPNTLEVPALSRPIAVTGLVVNGHTMIRLADLAAVLGAHTDYAPGSWGLWRNGQGVFFYPGTNYFDTAVSYEITDQATGTPQGYDLAWSGYTDEPPLLVGGERYVRLTVAAEQIGALMLRYNAVDGTVEVYDWRVNGSTPYADPNTYVVGGPWLQGWPDSGDTSLAPHFRLRELWDHSSPVANPEYAGQVKISTAVLQSLENLRHLNGDRPIYPSSGFRSWHHNVRTPGSWALSYHMRGRAADTPEDYLYRAVYDEFRGSYAAPLDALYGFWRPRTAGGYSGCAEIEQMEARPNPWLHCQRTPGLGTAAVGP